MNKLRLRRGDYVVLTIALLAAVLCCVQIWRPRDIGRTAVIVTPAGEQRHSLLQETVFTIKGKDGIVLSVEIHDGCVRVAHSNCPDQVCVHSGWLSQNGQAAACVPAGVSVRVLGGSQEVDGVTA